MWNNLVFYEDIKLQPTDHLYSTRFKEYAYKQPIATRDYYKYSFYPRTITEWNNLPREITLSSSLAAFKTAIFNIYWPYFIYLFIYLFIYFIILINNDFLKHKQAKIKVNSRRFGVIVTPFFLERSKMLSIERQT